jgi:hypothetical protein
MNKVLPLLAALVMAFSCIQAISQDITLKGYVKNASTNEPVPALSIYIKGTPQGTFTDDKGNFTIKTDRKLPLQLEFTGIGFEAQVINVSSENPYR